MGLQTHLRFKISCYMYLAEGLNVKDFKTGLIEERVVFFSFQKRPEKKQELASCRCLGGLV